MREAERRHEAGARLLSSQPDHYSADSQTRRRSPDSPNQHRKITVSWIKNAFYCDFHSPKMIKTHVKNVRRLTRIRSVQIEKVSGFNSGHDKRYENLY